MAAVVGFAFLVTVATPVGKRIFLLVITSIPNAMRCMATTCNKSIIGATHPTAMYGKSIVYGTHPMAIYRKSINNGTYPTAICESIVDGTHPTAIYGKFIDNGTHPWQLCRSCDSTAQGCGHGPLPWVRYPR